MRRVVPWPCRVCGCADNLGNVCCGCDFVCVPETVPVCIRCERDLVSGRCPDDACEREACADLIYGRAPVPCDVPGCGRHVGDCPHPAGHWRALQGLQREMEGK